MTLNFYVSYLVPVNPEEVLWIEKEIEVIKARLDSALAEESDQKAGELAITRLRAQMDPERRREPARQVSHSGRVDWFCPRPECKRCIATMTGTSVESDATCISCGATVEREELPMSLDLYRMRTRRVDGVEIQTEPRT